ncbi:MAG: ATP-grasp domain-containing protein [Acidobacteria bacterium]|nr:ATP-grasp domain-containing protein [Acidobacteriota bacterium]
MPRVLLLATTTGYQTRMFEEAARRMGVELVYGTDRCKRLDDPWQDGAVPVRFHDCDASVAAIERATAGRPLDGVIAVGDRPAVLAAHVNRHLGLPGHPPDAAVIARNKRRMRACLHVAGLPAPDAWPLALTDDAASLAADLPYPVVVKPTTLSASRGVIRADDEASCVAAVARVRRLLASPDVRAAREDEAGVLQVERYIEGAEYAVEGVMEQGRLRVLALFDKPDPLVGPFFEETIYVTPSRVEASTRLAIVEAVDAAIRAIGLHHGPVHAECRVAADGVYVLEVAARPIGGLCARALGFEPAAAAAGAPGNRQGLEDLLLRHALGEPMAGWTREAAASGVMMIPIPRAGVFTRIRGVDAARAVGGVEDVVVTAKPGQTLVPLPEGASYLGFIFARDACPATVEDALREAHGRLQVGMAPSLRVVG